MEEAVQQVEAPKKKKEKPLIEVTTVTGPAFVVENQDVMKLIHDLQDRVAKLEKHTHTGNGAEPTL
jgi:hypothetical protein